MKGYFGIIEAGLTLALVFGFGFWQLRSLKKMESDDKPKKDDKA
jgi:hypothetical protein